MEPGGITAVTGPDGMYLFENLLPGDYFVEFDLSTSPDAEFYIYTTPNQGDDDTDSDAVPDMPEDDVARSGTTDFLNGGESDLTLDAGVVCNVEAMTAPPATLCSTQNIDLTSGASITPASLGGMWTTSGDGTFDDGAGIFGLATTYTPGPMDVRRGQVTLTLTTNTPSTTSGCEADSSSTTFEILKVDCGSFPFNGGGGQ